MKHRPMGALAGLLAVCFGGVGTPVAPHLALLGVSPVLLALVLPVRGVLPLVAVQTSAALLLLRIPAAPAGLPLLCIGIVLCATGLVAHRHARVVFGIAWVQALRVSLLPAATALWAGTSFVWVGVAAGASSVFHRRQAWLVALGWTLLGLRGHQAQVLPLQGANHAQALARAGLLDLRDPGLRQDPWVGLAALTQRPQAHSLAADLLPMLGVRRLLWAGWHPILPAVPPEVRPSAVEALDALGRGGEALRLARRGAKTDPRLAWWAALLAREQGQPDPGSALAPLDGVPLLQEEPLVLGWTFLTEDTREQLVHLPRDLGGLILAADGQHHEGPPELRVDACGAHWQVVVPEGTGRITLPHALSAGPCRLRVSLVADRVDPAGDRNAVVLSVAGFSAKAQVFREK